jgi:uridine phosphorylase
MEAAAIFVVARVLGCRAGALLLVAGNQELGEANRRGEADPEPLLDGAIAGLRLLIARDASS